MVENKYDGPSLDHTWNSGPWADPDGETISGTSDDDMGEIDTTTLPDGVDPDNLTDTQRRVLERRSINPEENLKETAKAVGCSDTTVSRTLQKYTDYTPIEKGSKPVEERSFEDLNETQQRSLDMHIADNGMSDKEISRQLGKDETYTGRIKRQYDHVLEARRAELAIGGEGAADEAESESESGGMVKALIARARGWIAR